MADQGRLIRLNYINRAVGDSSNPAMIAVAEELVIEAVATAGGVFEYTLQEDNSSAAELTSDNSSLDTGSGGVINRILASYFLEPGDIGNVPTNGYNVYLEDADGAVGAGKDYFVGSGVGAGSNVSRVPITVVGGILSIAVNKLLTLKMTGLGDSGGVKLSLQLRKIG